LTRYEGFHVERAGPIATITLDVPGKMNRVAYAARAQLATVFDELGAEDDVRVVVLTGGNGNFSAGGDIAGFLEVSPEDLSTLARDVAAPERCPKPVIARIEGYCLGVGLELALACDFRVATESARLGLPEIGLGMIPGSGGTQRLARLAGLGRAKDVIMRRKRISAADAFAWGLVSEVVPEEELDQAIESIVDELRELSPLALAVAKRVLNEAYELPLREGLELEGKEYGYLRTTHDFREGVQAFAEKRKPKFRGE
jgi:2-oxoglutaroyl-CoA hydrolase